MLVVHGDQMDYAIKYARWLCVLGDIGYDLLLWANDKTGRIQEAFTSRRRWSLSKAVKTQVKKTITYISDFEKFLSMQARKQELDGVICGHIHIPEAGKVDEDGIVYINTGDWVENSTAIIEDISGKLTLITR